MNSFCVVTTINKPTKAIEALYEKFGRSLIVVGDTKTPSDWDYRFTRYMNPCKRPLDSYARKNIGYLEAMRLGADLIYDCDDDTYPNENFKEKCEYTRVDEGRENGWYNVYSVLSDEHIWARGFSLEHINKKVSTNGVNYTRKSSIQQCLVDGDPDVDAIWRLVLKREHSFSINKSIYLHPYSWCPFNSQATCWFPSAYALMYLPVFSKFRMCDIWRSFVAQRCLWELDDGVTFHSPSEFYQDRNKHNLLEDFKDEVDGYLRNNEIIETLEGLKLKQGEEDVCENLLACYQSIVNKGILPEMEINSLMGWIEQFKSITNG